MDERSFEVLRSHFENLPFNIFSGDVKINNSIDILAALLNDEDKEILNSIIVWIRSLAVREYLEKMREVKKKKDEEERKILYEMTGVEKSNKDNKLPGRLCRYDDRDGELPVFVLTSKDYL